MSNADVLSVVNNGNVGSSPTNTVTGFPSGVVNNGILFTNPDAGQQTQLAQAQTDLMTAYTAAQALPPTPYPQTWAERP